MTDARVIAAMEETPRAAFLQEDRRKEAEEDRPIPIGFGQTTSQPLIIGRMLELLDLAGDEKVLEIGAGCGYVSALLGRLCREAVCLEKIPALAEAAGRALAGLNISNACVICADGSAGWPQKAPYDRILVSAACARLPAAWHDQLKEDGILVAPIGPPQRQRLLKIRKRRDRTEWEPAEPCVFVPLSPSP